MGKKWMGKKWTGKSMLKIFLPVSAQWLPYIDLNPFLPVLQGLVQRISSISRGHADATFLEKDL